MKNTMQMLAYIFILPNVSFFFVVLYHILDNEGLIYGICFG